jgi:hypothetical protein
MPTEVGGLCEFKTLNDIWFQPAASDSLRDGDIKGENTIKLTDEGFSAVLTKYVSNYDVIQVMMSLYRAAWSSNIRLIDVKFLLMIQALEGLHRVLFDGVYMSSEAFDEKSARLIGIMVNEAQKAGFSDEQTQKIRDALGYSNEFNLRARLKDISSWIDQKVSSVNNQLDKQAINEIVDARNKLSHAKVRDINGEAWYRMYITLRRVFEIIILRWHDMDERYAPNIIRRNS